MKAQVLTGSKNEIAQTVVSINGKIHEVIVFVEEASDRSSEEPQEDIFAEMDAFSVKAGGADYSRQSLYTPLVGE